MKKAIVSDFDNTFTFHSKEFKGTAAIVGQLFLKEDFSQLGQIIANFKKLEGGYNETNEYDAQAEVEITKATFKIQQDTINLIQINPDDNPQEKFTDALNKAIAKYAAVGADFLASYIRKEGIDAANLALNENETFIISTATYPEIIHAVLDKLVEQGSLKSKEHIVVQGPDINWPEKKLVHLNFGINKLKGLDAYDVQAVFIDDPLSDRGIINSVRQGGTVNVIKTTDNEKLNLKNLIQRDDVNVNVIPWNEKLSQPDSHPPIVHLKNAAAKKSEEDDLKQQDDPSSYSSPRARAGQY